MNYEWDSRKARSNFQKHGVDFADAVGVFEDPHALTVDEQFQHGEERSVTTGMDFLGRHLTVVYTWREDRIRIISARQATKNERSHYENERI